MVILDLLITLSTFRSSSIRECIITIVLGIAALLREWCWLVWKEMIPNLCRCSWDSNRKHSTYKFSSWEEEAIQAAKLVWGGRKWTRIKVARLGTVGFESIFPLKKKNTQNDNSEGQLSSLHINISAQFWDLWSLRPPILFSNSMPPCQEVTFFPSLNKQLG